MEQKEYNPTEGEEILMIFFDENGYEYDFQKEIDRLKGDSKSFRIADFYLPKYDVFVEFLGQWNLPKERERYLEKKNIYKANDVSCIYIYPENLGVIDLLFSWRLEELLLKQNRKKDIFMHRFKQLNEPTFLVILLIVLTVFTILNGIEWALIITSSLALLLYFRGLFLWVRDTKDAIKRIDQSKN